MPVSQDLLRGLFFGDLPQLDLHGTFAADAAGRIDDFLDPFYIDGGYVRIVGGLGAWKLMPAIDRHLVVLKNKGRIRNFWIEESAASYIVQL